jgi:hypothetical protein
VASGLIDSEASGLIDPVSSAEASEVIVSELGADPDSEAAPPPQAERPRSEIAASPRTERFLRLVGSMGFLLDRRDPGRVPGVRCCCVEHILLMSQEYFDNVSKSDGWIF